MMQPPIPVKQFTVGEWALGAIVGLLRQVSCMLFGSEPDWEDGTEHSGHVLGALGEGAWHKWRNIWWPAPLNEWKQPDAEGCIQIRTSPRATAHTRPFFKVKPRNKDNPSWMVVFITGRGLNYEIVGCMRAGEAQRKYPLIDPGKRNSPCHQVPLEDMHSVKEFTDELDALRQLTTAPF